MGLVIDNTPIPAKVWRYFPIRDIVQEVLERDDFNLVDLHFHSINHRKLHVSPTAFTKLADDKGLDAIVQCEHNKPPCHADDEILESLYDVNILPGIEISVNNMHLTIMGQDDGFYNYLLKKNIQKLGRFMDTVYAAAPDAMVIAPHAYQLGGIFYSRPKNQKGDRKWLPEKGANRMFFYEVTNGRYAVNEQNTWKLIQLVRERERNIMLVGGSDAHFPAHLGTSGNIAYGPLSVADIKEQFREGTHSVYSIRMQRNGGDFQGRFNLLDPRGESWKSYLFSYDHQKKKIRLNSSRPEQRR